jgi:hypothetical protein
VIEGNRFVIKLMEKLIEGLNLSTLVDENDEFLKISLSPQHSRAQLLQPIDDYYSDHLNNHIALGKGTEV